MTTEIVIVDILGGHGRVLCRERVTLSAEQRRFTIGRSVEADVTLDDPYAAALHAVVEIAPDGTITVSDQGTANAIIVGGHRHRGAQSLVVLDGLLQIGRTPLRIRTTQQALAPEKADYAAVNGASVPVGLVIVCAAICGLFVAYLGWLSAPRDTASIIVTSMLSASIAAGVWVGGWALLSRILLGEWRWVQHAAVLFGVTAVLLIVSLLLNLGWFVFTLPAWGAREVIEIALALAVALYWHLMHASNLTHRRAAVIAILLPAIGFGAGGWVQSRTQARDVNHIGTVETIYPPGLRVRAAEPSERYFNRLSALKAIADRKRAAIRADEENDAAAPTIGE